jgi:hypothetical protein
MGASGTRYEIHRRRSHPTDTTLTLADLEERRSSDGKLHSGHLQRSCLDPDAVNATSSPATTSVNAYGRTTPSSLRYTTMAGTTSFAAALGHEGMPLPPSVSLYPLCLLIKPMQKERFS